MISKILKEHRLKEGKTQKEMSEVLRISRSTYNNYEQNIAEPNIETLIKLADYFHTTVDNLLDHKVPYLIDKSCYTDEQQMLIDEIAILDREQCRLTKAYIDGLNEGKRRQEELLKKLRGETWLSYTYF